jgi:prepilin-type N-terminal cleavage/methylation domain-containing protein
MTNQNSKSFTLIELLIVLALISILATILILTINPGGIFSRARDTKRINDLKNIEKIMDTLYSTEYTFNEFNYASSNVVYISLPDNNTNCSNWLSELPSLPSGWSYRCSATPTNIDGTGWIPIPFSNFPILNISQLPVDPINKPPYYYSFVVGGSYKVTDKPEENYSPAINDGGIEPLLYEAGSDKKLSTFQSGLVGYWSFDEGSGTTARDLSGFGNNGTLYSSTTICSNPPTSGCPTWTTGKVGGALSFDGSDDWVRVSNSTSLDINKNISVFAWVNRSRIVDWERVVGKFYWSGESTGSWDLNLGQGYLVCEFNINGNWIYASAPAGTNNATGTWYFVGCVYDGSRLYNYVNGELKATSMASGNITTTTYPLAIGTTSNGTDIQNVIQGIIDEVRIYNRALSDSEIKVLYQSAQ